MGEKETMTGAEMREAGSGMATGRAAGASSAGEKAMTAREAGSGMATGRVAAADLDGDGKAEAGTHEDTWESPARVAAADVDGDGTAEQRAHGDTSGGKSMREGGGGDPAGIAIGDPGVNGNITGTASDGNDAAVNTSHSNIKRDDGGGAAGIAIDEPGVHASSAMRPGDPIPDIDHHSAPPSSETTIIKSKSNITNN